MTQEREKTWTEYELELSQADAKFWRLAVRYSNAMLLVVIVVLACFILGVNPLVAVVAGGLALLALAFRWARKMREV